MIKTRPALFKWRHFEPEIIVARFVGICGSHFHIAVSRNCSQNAVCRLAIKWRVNASQGFRSFDGALRTIQGYEIVHMIRMGQVRWLPKADVMGQILFIRETLGLKS